MIDENCKLKYCLDYESNLEDVIKETPEFLAKYITKINNAYNNLVDKIIELQNENKSLRSEIKVHSKKSNERYKAIKIQEEYISKLHLEAQKYFDNMMDAENKYNKALELLVENDLPCNKDNFMDKNIHYCSMNCSLDEEIFKNCWNRYIEQELENEKK